MTSGEGGKTRRPDTGEPQTPRRAACVCKRDWSVTVVQNAAEHFAAEVNGVLNSSFGEVGDLFIDTTARRARSTRGDGQCRISVPCGARQWRRAVPHRRRAAASWRVPAPSWAAAET
jgi:hypothetical protein